MGGPGDLVRLTSPRARGEVGAQSAPGEGDSPSTALAERAPHPTPPPVKDGERERKERGSLFRAHLFDFGIARQIVGAVAIDGVDHHALAVLECGLADESAE